MTVVSILRTPAKSLVTLSGVELPRGIDVTLSRKMTYTQALATAPHSPWAPSAITVSSNGLVVVLFGNGSKACRPENHVLVFGAYAPDDGADRGVHFVSRLLRNAGPRFNALLACYGQCHVIRSDNEGRPFVTSFRGHYAFLAFRSGPSGPAAAEEACARFESWAASGCPDSPGLQPFHLAALVKDGVGAGPGDVVQIGDDSGGQTAQVRLWFKPNDPGERPALEFTLSIPSREVLEITKRTPP